MTSERLSLDTSAACLLFGLARGSFADERRQADLESLIREGRYELVIPAPVIAELIHGAFNENPREFVEELERLHFPIVPLRSNVAETFLNHSVPLPSFRQLASTSSQHKEVVKIDILIAVSAIGAGSHLCTFDESQAGHFERYAKGTGLEAGPARHFGTGQSDLPF